MNKEKLYEILEGVKNNDLNIDDAFERLKTLPFDDLGYAKIDNHREIRVGYPEVIYCEGKAIEHVLGIIDNMRGRGGNIFGTRVSDELMNVLEKKYDDIVFNRIGRTFFIKLNEIKETNKKVIIVTGGTSDLKVCEEAYETCRALGTKVEKLVDVGVAGIHRLFSNMDKLREASVVIAVAGMEGALASVVGGLVDTPVIAVPTSVGYGAHFGGLAPLLSMLNSCSSGVGVVNIDNGFGAAYLASTIIKQIERG